MQRMPPESTTLMAGLGAAGLRVEPLAKTATRRSWAGTARGWGGASGAASRFGSAFLNDTLVTPHRGVERLVAPLLVFAVIVR